MKGEFFTILDQLGLAWQNIINGVVGAAVWAIHTKSKFWASIRQTFIGAIVAGYTTPVIASKMSIQSTGFLSFVVGMIGLVLLDAVYKWTVKKVKLLF